MKNWINRKLGLISLALSRVEKDAFAQKPDAVSSGGELEQGYNQGMLANSLLKMMPTPIPLSWWLRIWIWVSRQPKNLVMKK